jgi:hypothetical protein
MNILVALATCCLFANKPKALSMHVKQLRQFSVFNSDEVNPKVETMEVSYSPTHDFQITPRKKRKIGNVDRDICNWILEEKP